MTDAVTVSAPGTGDVGAFLPITGTVTGGIDTVQLQLASQNAALPTGPWYATPAAGGVFTSLLLPVAAGTWYVWAYDPVSGAQGVSGPVAVGSSGQMVVPIPTNVVATLLGGSAAGETADELMAAAVVSDSDTALVAQGSKVLFTQNFSAIWAWIQGHLPGYLMPQVTVSVSSTVNLDNSAHNQRVLLVTASGVTIAPLIASLGPGFACDVINASGSPVALVGIITDTGGATIPIGGIARILVVMPPSGTLTVYATL